MLSVIPRQSSVNIEFWAEIFSCDFLPVSALFMHLCRPEISIKLVNLLKIGFGFTPIW